MPCGFRQDKIKLEIRLNKSLNKSTQEENLDTYQQKQLRKVLGMKYSTRLSNAKLYEKCTEMQISITVMKPRWRLFSHILRRDKDIPDEKAIQFYFDKSPTDTNFRGREHITLPAILARDLDRLSVGDHTYCKHL